MSKNRTYQQKLKIGIYLRNYGTWEVRATVILADGSKKRRSFYKKTECEAQSFKVVLMGRANTTGGVLYDEDVDEMLAMINRGQNRIQDPENQSDEEQEQPQVTNRWWYRPPIVALTNLLLIFLDTRPHPFSLVVVVDMESPRPLASGCF